MYTLIQYLTLFKNIIYIL